MVPMRHHPLNEYAHETCNAGTLARVQEIYNRATIEGVPLAEMKDLLDWVVTQTELRCAMAHRTL